MRSRPRRSRFPTSLAAELQQLEARVLPTGTVTALLSNGNLAIGGDNFDNNILIAVRTTGVYLTGLQDADSDPATFTKIKVDGTTYEEGEEILLTDTVSLKNVTVLMRGGNDNVRVDVGVASTEPEPDAPDAVVTGRVRINLGKGDDHGVLLLNNGTLTIGGNLEGDLENGDDCLLVGTEGLLTGSDTPPEPPDTLPIQVGGNVIILGRLGKDVIGLAGVEVQRGVTIQGGEHVDSLALNADKIHGNLYVSGDAATAMPEAPINELQTLVLQNVEVLGATTIRGGGGVDRVLIENLKATKNVAIKLYAGDDQISVETLTLGTSTKVTIDGGVGSNDEFNSSETPSTQVKFSSIEDSETDLDSINTDAILDDVVMLIQECLDATLIA